jgi:hypothetical protein
MQHSDNFTSQHSVLSFVLASGEGVRRFRAHGLAIEAHVEPGRAPGDVSSLYPGATWVSGLTDRALAHEVLIARVAAVEVAAALFRRVRAAV